jgi:uncharacterized membrane protein
MRNDKKGNKSLAQTAALGSSLCIALPIAGICSIAAGHFLNHSSATVVLGLGAPFFIFLTGAAMYSVLKKYFESSKAAGEDELEKTHDQFLMRTVMGGALALFIGALATRSCSTDVMMISALAAFAVGSLVAGLGVELIKQPSAPQSEGEELTALGS